MMRLSAQSIGLKVAAGTRRTFVTSSQRIPRAGRRAVQDNRQLQQSFRRSYADAAPSKKPRRFRYFRYAWRLTYLSVIGGTAYLGYGVYEARHPEDQFQPDPTKKNLVILGQSSFSTLLTRTIPINDL